MDSVRASPGSARTTAMADRIRLQAPRRRSQKPRENGAAKSVLPICFSSRASFRLAGSIYGRLIRGAMHRRANSLISPTTTDVCAERVIDIGVGGRSEEHTSELQSPYVLS